MTDPRWIELSNKRVLDGLTKQEVNELERLASGSRERQSELAVLDALELMVRQSSEIDEEIEVKPAGTRLIVALAPVAVLAAAALVVLLLRPTTPSDDEPRIVFREGSVAIRPQEHSHLRPGDTIAVADGKACVSFGPTTKACTDVDTVVSIGRGPKLVLESGRLFAEASTPLTIEVGAVRATGVARFTVEVAGERVEAHVEQGSIEVETPERHVSLGQDRRLVASNGTLIEDDPVAEVPPRPSEPSPGEAPSRVETQGMAAGSSESEAEPVGSKSDRSPRSRPIQSRPSSQALLHAARDAMRRDQAGDAAKVYEHLLATYPRSAESRSARVSLAQLYLYELSRPKRAQQLFEAYLKHGGPLSLQARHGAVIAAARLGRPAQEAAAIRSLLEHHPRSAHVPALRRRLLMLEEEL